MLTNKGKYGLKALVHLAGLPPGGALAEGRAPAQRRFLGETCSCVSRSFVHS